MYVSTMYVSTVEDPKGQVPSSLGPNLSTQARHAHSHANKSLGNTTERMFMLSRLIMAQRS